jgi:anti-sigma regulatory factor (Ser/Thr protein kinase)
MPAIEAQTHATTPAVTIRFERTYQGAADQLRRVRADLRQVLADCPAADDAIVCASELAANAVLHSTSGEPGGTFTICAEICPGLHIRIQVRDHGSFRIPRQLSYPADRPHGLDIVALYADQWGTTGDIHQRTTWASVRWTGNTSRAEGDAL